MVIKGKLIYNKAIILNESRMRELHEILQRNYRNIEYHVQIESKSSIVFANLDELLSYDNHSKRKIISIYIRCTLNGSYDTTNIHIDEYPGLFVNYSRTIEVDYSVMCTDDEMKLRNALMLLFDKAKASHWLVSKFTIMQLVILYGGYAFIKFLLQDGNTSTISLTKIEIVVITAISIALAVITRFLYNRLWKSIFPSIVFSWGEEASVDNKRYFRRTQIFWGLTFCVVSVIIGLLLK